MKLLLEAMAEMEGYYINGSRPRRNKNPLDLEWGNESQRFGATKGDPRFAVFERDLTGWVAAARWLSVPARFSPEGALIGGYLGATLSQVIFRFAPSVENDSHHYLDFVCQHTGLTPETVLTTDLLTIPNLISGGPNANP